MVLFLQTSKTSSPPPITDEAVVTTSPNYEDEAELFARLFCTNSALYKTTGKIFQKFHTKKSSVYNRIPEIVMKNSASELFPILTHFFQISY